MTMNAGAAVAVAMDRSDLEFSVIVGCRCFGVSRPLVLGFTHESSPQGRRRLDSLTGA
jgi:hypothetical protein